MNWLLRTLIVAIVAGLAARGVVSIAHDGWLPRLALAVSQR